ncbi:MAG: hypothetical protein AB9861_03075 [Methanosarcina sp.]
MQEKVIFRSSQGANEEEKKTHSIDIPGCIRRLSTSERVGLWSLAADVAVAARIVGDIEEKKSFTCYHAVRQMHPLVGAKVIFDYQHSAWFSTDNVPKTIFYTVPRKSETQWIDEIQHEYLIPFEAKTGPLIRFVLVYSRLVSELIVFAHHIICDGMTLANLIHDILMFYAEPANEVQIIHSSAEYLQKYEHDSLSKDQVKSLYGHMINSRVIFLLVT